MFSISKSLLEKIQNLVSVNQPSLAFQSQGVTMYGCSSCSGGCRGGCNGCDGCKGK